MKKELALLFPKDRLNTLLVGHSEKPATFFRVGVNTESLDAVEYTSESIHAYLNAASINHYTVMQEPNALTVYSGADAGSFSRLIQASEQANDREMGVALGYPASAIEAYCRNDNPRRANPDFFEELLAAKDAGVDIPSWIGYISHLPSVCDLVSGEICEESAKLGTHYRKVAAAIDPENLSAYDQIAQQMVPHRKLISDRGEQSYSWN